jgi:conjugative transposon TraN protein
MKWNRALVKAIILILFATQSFAQFEKTSFIQSYHLYITCNKTTNLIFPFAIQSADRGSKDVLAQKVTGAENILQVKAAKPNFSETNLSVITSEGKLYSFIVNYTNEPSELNIVFQKDTLVAQDIQPALIKEPVILFETNNAAELNTIAQRVKNAKRSMHAVNDKHDAMKLSLKGLYVHRDVFYFQLVFQNKSNISYNIEAIRFFIRDKQKSKRTATQEREIHPLYMYGNDTNLKEKSSDACVIALPKFTLPDAKYLSLQVLEKNGGRDLHLSLGDRNIMNAKTISVTD